MKNYFAEFFAQVRGSGTQSEWAVKLGISQGSMSDLARGNFAPSYEVLQRFVELGYNPTAMLLGVGPLNLGDVGKQLPSAVTALAGRLAKYPDLIEPLSKTIEAHENLVRVQESLKTEFHRKKKK